jgi:tetratricopeptide (TPR) repeat protein
LVHSEALASKLPYLSELSQGLVSNGATPRRKQERRFTRTALLLVCLAVAVRFAFALSDAWAETTRREAYLPDLQAMVRRTPYDGQLLSVLAARLMEAGAFTEATGAFRGAVAAGDDREDVWICLAATEAASGARRDAMADLMLGLKAHPGSPALMEAAKAAEALPKSAGGPQLAKVIAGGQPYGLLAARTRGSFLNDVFQWWGRQHPEASGFATREAWLREDPDNPRVIRLWADALAKNARYSEALQTAQLAVKAAPNSPEANLLLAQSLQSQGNHRAAVVQYLTCLRLRADWEPALVGLADTLGRLGAPGAASNLYQKVVQQNPKSVEGQLGLGRSILETSVALPRAVAAFETAQRLAPHRTDFFGDFANALRQTGQEPRAEAILRKRLAEVPDDSYAHFILGRVLMEYEPSPEREKAAEAEFRTAIRLSPGNPGPNAQLGRLLLARGDATRAVLPLRTALAAKPFDDSTIRVLAKALYQTGKTAEAARTIARSEAILSNRQVASQLEEQLKVDQANIPKRLRLADLYARTGKLEEAREQREKAQLIRSGGSGTRVEKDGFRTQLQQLLGGSAPAPG